ncbi:MAG: sugar transferase [Acidobacteria bacterium]|nr:sugar transferase [Acidobacteriota bacterium]
MFSRQHRKARFLFGLSDVAIVTLAFEAAYRLRLALPLERSFALSGPVKALLLGCALVAWVSLGYSLEVYERLDSARRSTILRVTTRQCVVGAVAIVLAEYLLRLDLSRSFLALFVTATWLLLLLFRWNSGRLVGWIRREFGGPHHVLIVGTGSTASAIARRLESSAVHGIRISGFLAPDEHEAPAPDLGPYVVRPLAALPDLLRRHVVDEIIFAVPSPRLDGLEEIFLLCDEEGVRTRVAVDFFPHVNSEVYLDRLDSLPLLTFSATPHDEIRLFIKRVTDVAAASLALLVLAPFLGLIALLIKATSAGPVIFRQERCGLNGRRFAFYKFRSMVADAERMKDSLEHMNVRSGPVFKIPNDPRLTSLGRFLRKYSIDELPQLWNVLKGDMSIVGPRPAVASEVEKYARWQRRRLRMRPGLTCLWALHGRDSVDFETWMKMDMEYIDTWSLGLDWKIILRTIPQVILGKGAN